MARAGVGAHGLEVLRIDAPHPRATLVLVHGAWHGAWCWHEGFAQRLADRGISTVAPSLRGHGGSADGIRLNSLSIRDYVDDLDRVISDVASDSGVLPFVAGHSMGGAVVQGCFSRPGAPAIAGAAMLAAIPPHGLRPVTPKVVRSAPGAFVLAGLTLDLGRLVRSPKQVRQLFFRPETSTAVVEWTVARLQSESFRVFVVNLLSREVPAPHPVDIPILVVGAVQDGLFTPDMVARTAKGWGTEPVMVDGIGHDLMLDDGWERVADLLADWVLAQTG